MLICRSNILSFCFQYIQYRNSICIQWRHFISSAVGIYNSLCWQNARGVIQAGFTILRLATRDLQTVILIYYYNRLYRNLLFECNLFFIDIHRFWNSNVQLLNKLNSNNNKLNFFNYGKVQK